jgi:hypothetical protein
LIINKLRQTSWGGEKGFADFSFTGDIFEGKESGDIVPKESTAEGFYRLTVDLNTNTINVVTYTLP